MEGKGAVAVLNRPLASGRLHYFLTSFEITLELALTLDRNGLLRDDGGALCECVEGAVAKLVGLSRWATARRPAL